MLVARAALFASAAARARRSGPRRPRTGGRVLVVDMLPHDRQEYQQQMGHVWLGFLGEADRRGSSTGAGFGECARADAAGRSGCQGAGVVRSDGSQAVTTARVLLCRPAATLNEGEGNGNSSQ